MLRLGVNIDHVATLRQARKVTYPDPLEAALAAERAGADAITVHLREDRRHIQDNDLFRIRSAIKIHLNQELAPTDEMVELCLRVHPDEVCLVPERRQELTTEGGLDVAAHFDRLKPIIKRLKQSRILVSLFVDPELAQLQAAADLAADYVELHTGTYANFTDGARCAADAASFPGKAQDKAEEELEKLRDAAKQARALKLKPNAGHGLNYQNVVAVTELPGLQWLQ